MLCVFGMKLVYFLPLSPSSSSRHSSGHLAFSKLRSTSRRDKQTPDGLHRRIDSDNDSKGQQGIVDCFGLSSLGTCFEVEQGWVDETQRDATRELLDNAWS